MRLDGRGRQLAAAAAVLVLGVSLGACGDDTARPAPEEEVTTMPSSPPGSKNPAVREAVADLATRLFARAVLHLPAAAIAGDEAAEEIAQTLPALHDLVRGRHAAAADPAPYWAALATVAEQPGTHPTLRGLALVLLERGGQVTREALAGRLRYWLSLPSEAAARLDEAREQLAGRRLINRKTDEPFGQITFSGGVADVFGYNNARDALKAADDALYRAKESGRNRIELAGI